MDRRKYTRVALAAGLLFLFFTEICMLFAAGTSFRHRELSVLGALVMEHPELETEYIEFFNKNLKESRVYEETGRKLEERYGYRLFEGESGKIYLIYGIGISVLLISGLGITALLLVQNKKQRQFYERKQEELQEQYKELQNHFQKVKDRLSQEENRTKSFITDISHQLKTPIASLKLSFELAGSEVLTEQERISFYQKEKNEIQRLENLLGSLIHVSRLETGMIQLRPEKQSIRKTLIKAVNSVYMKAFQKHIDISLQEFQDIDITHDSRWTTEVFVNILDNAIKYSPEHTEIQIQVTELATYLMLEFMDQGTSISTEESYLVFQRFYRGKQTFVKNQEGSGVGLYLARKILEEQKGTICVKSLKQGGNNFIVTLPK